MDLFLLFSYCQPIANMHLESFENMIYKPKQLTFLTFEIKKIEEIDNAFCLIFFQVFFKDIKCIFKVKF